MAGSCEGVVHVNEVLTLHMGPDFLLVNIGLDFDNTITAERVERTIAGLDQEIKAAVPEVKRVFVEAESRRKSQVAL